MFFAVDVIESGGTARGLEAGLLLCGMASIIVNALLVIATIKIIQPGRINPSE